MSEKRTLDKCKKIMQMFQREKPKQTSALKQKPVTNKNFATDKKQKMESTPTRVSFCLPAKRKDQSNSKNSLRPSFNKSASSIKSAQKSDKSQSNSKNLNRKSFTSIYNAESRYQKIMKLNIKPTQKRREQHKNSYLGLNASKISFGSDVSSRDRSQSKQSRLDKIMKLKVHKPRVDSTLRNYNPVKQQRKSISKSKQNIDYNTVLQLKKCKQIMKKQVKQIQKQDRLWKVFERQRQLRMKQKQKKQRAQYQKQRSLQKRFDSLVQKQLKRIQAQKQLDQRRQQGFSTYLFPSY